MPSPSLDSNDGGEGGNRTRDGDFANLSLTTWPPRLYQKEEPVVVDGRRPIKSLSSLMSTGLPFLREVS